MADSSLIREAPVSEFQRGHIAGRIEARKMRTQAAQAIATPASPAPISYPPDTEDRLCDVAGSVRSAANLLEHLPFEIMERDDGYLVNVIHQLQIIEREVRAIVHSAVELQAEVAHG
jgi:hypothetical protein